MIIRYADGRALEGVLVRHTEGGIRVALPGSEDIMEFTQVNQTWVSEDCEPVRIEFGQPSEANAEVSLEVDNFICSHELAAHLLHLLWNGSDEDAWPTGQAASAAGLAAVSNRRLMLN